MRPSNLATQQQRFAALLQGQADDTLLSVHSPARVQAYTNNHRLNLAAALAGAYPIIQQLVGEEFFSAMADVYIARTPSQSGNLHQYGATFSDFLTTFPPVETLPYLPDVARLEWALQCAYYAPDIHGTPPSELAQTLATYTAEQLSHATFSLHPSLSLLTSPYPLCRIWDLHQTTTTLATDIDLNQGECCLIARFPEPGPHGPHRVAPLALPPAEAMWIQALQKGDSFARALDAACAITPDFTPDKALALLWQNNLWIGVETSATL